MNAGAHDRRPPGAAGPAGPAAPAVDSAGVPWQGRTLGAQPFAGDDGTADPALAQALAAYARGEADEGSVVAALAGTRLLVAVRQVVDGDHNADMALVTLDLPGGARALPVFSGVATLAELDPLARPVPVEAERAALSAVAEHCSELHLDGDAFVVRRPALWALAQGRAWLPPHRDPEVRAAVEQACAGVDGVVGVRCEAGTGDLDVVLLVRPGLGRAGLDAIVARVRQGLADEPVVPERVDRLQLRLLPAPPPSS